MYDVLGFKKFVWPFYSKIKVHKNDLNSTWLIDCRSCPMNLISHVDPMMKNTMIVKQKTVEYIIQSVQVFKLQRSLKDLENQKFDDGIRILFGRFRTSKFAVRP